MKRLTIEMGLGVAFAVAVAIGFGLLSSCGNNGGTSADPDVLSGRVTNGDGTAIAGATVYLVPTTSVNTWSPITAADLDTTGTPASVAWDEPLEDAVASSGTTFPQAVTDSSGQYSITAPSGKYYVFVKPSGTEYLPGGDACRISRTGGGTFDIKVSSSPSATATYVGSAQCVGCHANYAGQKYTAHRLGISVPGALGPLQDAKNFPNYNDALSYFATAATYDETDGSTIIKATVLSFGDYDGTRGFDKFKIYPATKAAGGFGGITKASQIGVENGRMFLWKNSGTGEYTITLTNITGAPAPDNVTHFPVKLTYGGTVYKQRFLVGIPAGLATRSGRYPLLQFQSYPGISKGADGHYDRTRATWRDYHLDWFWDQTTNTAKAPKAKDTFEGQCAGCHMPGMTVLQVPVDDDTEGLVGGIEDNANGEFDIDGDGTKNELNVGCESCHGPGSEHAAANDLSATSRYIVALKKLSPSREVMVCAACHDRSQGNGSVSNLKKDVLFDATNQLPRPGMSRAEVIAAHMSRKGPKITDFNTDEIHSKSHHQQYSDFIKSKKYRNDRQLVVCSDCHDSHAYRSLQGLVEYPHNLRDNPNDPNSTLCMQCHALTPITHMDTETGAKHSGEQTRCSDCHMPRTAKSGAGQYGFLLDAPTGVSTDADLVYWMGDISSHVFDFVKKSWTGVAGKQPGTAMAAPYVNKCGACHDPSLLRYQNPDSP